MAIHFAGRLSEGKWRLLIFPCGVWALVKNSARKVVTVVTVILKIVVVVVVVLVILVTEVGIAILISIAV